MNATGAVVFLPREGNGPSLMLEELLFDPAALWLAESLRAAGVERFFVVCHTDDQARAAACFPAGTEFVTGGSGDAVEQLSAFLNALEGKVIVITKPVLLDWGDARTLAGLENGGVLDSKDTGVYRIDGGLLSQTLAEGVGLEEALKEKGDRFNSRGVWFQGAYPIRSGWNGRMEAEMVARQHGVRRLLEAGVRIMDPSHCYVGPRVKVGEGTVLLPGTILRGETIIGRDCEVGPNAMVRDCTVGDGVTINASQLNESTIGEGTKISHLTYVGDSDVGGHVNFGCGTVTVNYDGTSKFRTVIGDHAFIGCNTNLVAPVRVGEGAYTAAGSTITDEVPADSLAIARTRQTVKKQWAAKRRNRRK